MLAQIPRWANENVLVGFDTADDAGVYKLTPECALVQTVDFFTPIVDDPYTFGAIAAANALSDVYAMGGRPISALSILAWPAKGDLDDLAQILKGGAEKIHEADCALSGRPQHRGQRDQVRLCRHRDDSSGTRSRPTPGARAGDALVLTKRIGTGVIATALKRGIAKEADVQAAIESMLTLNRRACEAMLAVRCAWLHGRDRLRTDRPCARDGAGEQGDDRDRFARRCGFSRAPWNMRAQGAIPGGLKNNREFAGSLRGRASRNVDDLLVRSADVGRAADFGSGKKTCPGCWIGLPGAYRVGRVLERREKPLRIV